MTDLFWSETQLFGGGAFAALSVTQLTRHLQAVLEASGLKDEELGTFLRRKGLHEAILAEWKAAALEALAPQKKTGDSRRVRELEKQLRRKDKALAEAAALLVLQKKVRALLGDEDDDTGPKSDE